MMNPAALLCLLLMADPSPKVEDLSYAQTRETVPAFTPAPLLPEEVYQRQEERIAATFEKLKAQGEREARAVTVAPNDKVRRSDAVRVVDDVRNNVNRRLENPKVARELESVQVPAGEVVPSGYLSWAVGEILRLARRTVEDDRVSFAVRTEPHGAAFALCLEYDPGECDHITTPGDFVGVFRGRYQYTIVLDGYKTTSVPLNLTGFARQILDCRLYPATGRPGPSPCTPR